MHLTSSIRVLVCALLGFFALSVCRGGVLRAVAVDQMGYLPGARKLVFSRLAADSFFVQTFPAGTTVFRGQMQPWKTLDPSTGQDVVRGDFTSQQSPGRYRIVLSTGDSSSVFDISDTVYVPLARGALKAFYFQRCGTALLSMYAGSYQHGSCHLIDAFFHASADSNGKYHPATGGWHDAGDYGKYIVNAGISVGTLLMAYEMFPARFSSDAAGIPESGNGVPDILDEARYELEWFLKMQRADGAFWFKLTPKQFEAFTMPHTDNSTRYIYQVSSAATGDGVAVLAKAARLFAPIDTAFSRRCLLAARRGWDFLDANPSIIPSGGFKNPADTYTGEYGDGDDDDERLWASAELFETTGDSAYHEDFLTRYVFGSVFSSTMWWGDVRPMGLLTYMRSMRPNADPSARNDLRQGLAAYCASQIAKRNASGYHVVLQPGQYVWGSNSEALNAAVLLIADFAERADSTCLQVAADQLHYVLGVNGYARGYVTGYGESPPMHPHHRPSESDGIVAPVPGLLVGGPNQYLGDPVLQALFNGGTPPALCYADSMPSYASNEIAINWNAPLAFVTGYFGGVKGPESVGELNKLRPAGFLLDQNYPNPFNPTTSIEYAVGGIRNQASGVSDVRLVVYDLLGREVATLVNERKAPGQYEVEFDASGLGSGVYFYRLTAGQYVECRKMVLMK